MFRPRLFGFAASLAIAACILACGGRSGVPVALAPEGTGDGKAGVFPSESVKVGATTREYRLIVPKSADLAKPVPLVVAFHGMGIDSKDLMPKYTELDRAAEKHGFVLAFPEAIGKNWGLSPDKVKADLDFFDALLAKLKGDYKIDADRIFATGMSNGGYFAHLVGKERSTVVAAVASHSGPLGLQTLFGIKAERKFPAMIVHGDKDIIFPVGFARENRDKYAKEGHEVKYVELKGHGHMWATEDGIDDAIWTFFEEHPLPKKK